MKDVVTDPEKVTRILKTATEIFGQQGFIKSKTDQIANQAQVSKGLLFHYFGNKQALYLTLSNMPIIEFMITWTPKSGRMPLAWLP